jgi:hypothetical protein
MATSRQELLKEAWLGGTEGHLSALSEARAWALREAWRDAGKPQYGMLTYIAGKVKKVGKAGRAGGNPTLQALLQFFAKIDADASWYPGKSTQKSFGPTSAITLTNQAIVARSAMAMAERGEEVTYGALVANNPKALENPATKEPVGKKRVYAILEERCYDDPDDPEDTWEFQARSSKKALTDTEMEKRLSWARYMQGLRWQAWWSFKWVVWTDICNTLLPTSEKRHNAIVLSNKRGKGWGSSKTKLQSKNLRGKPEARKQKGYDSVRVYWAPILTRGKLHVELLGEDFPGETPEGAAMLVAKVRAALNVRFQAAADAPNLLFTDRGQGFFHINGGRITDEYKAALREHNLKSYCGDDASRQPGNCQEMMLHETSVAWIRYREARTLPRQPWTETVAEFRTRLKGICEHINTKHDVDGLCRAFPQRLQMLVDAEGDRIGK